MTQFEQLLTERVRFLTARIHAEGPRRDYLCERDCLLGVLEDYRTNPDKPGQETANDILRTMQDRGLVSERPTYAELAVVATGARMAAIMAEAIRRKEDARRGT